MGMPQCWHLDGHASVLAPRWQHSTRVAQARAPLIAVFLYMAWREGKTLIARAHQLSLCMRVCVCTCALPGLHALGSLRQIASSPWRSGHSRAAAPAKAAPDGAGGHTESAGAAGTGGGPAAAIPLQGRLGDNLLRTTSRRAALRHMVGEESGRVAGEGSGRMVGEGSLRSTASGAMPLLGSLDAKLMRSSMRRMASRHRAGEGGGPAQRR